ncbi:sialic acid-binding Ig-like lectin 14 [Heptranchias perlo]|uniref:sialic acid-binding Ig-like lectin 14 n=1 Tax=Heptranchias perlo TaxID=212740 RepID=UPI00355A4015
MQLLLKLFLILQTGVRGFPLVETVLQPCLVSVLRGESVIINCTFNYRGNDSDWVRTAWYTRSPGFPTIHYEENKPTCIPDVAQGGFSRCVASLKIENVSYGHSNYSSVCVVKVPIVYPPLERKGQGTRIQIYEPPDVSIVDGALIAGRKSKLTCSAKGLSFENISFTWACRGTNISTNVTTLSIKRTGDGTSVVTNQLEIVPKVRNHGSVCRCQINHVTFRQPVINEIILHVMYGPQDPTIMYRFNNTGSYHPVTSNSITVPPDSSLELRCTVESNPASSVIWVKDGRNHTQVLPSAAGLNSSKVKLINFQSEDGGVYWCTANNSYGWGNASVWIKVEQKDHWWPFVLAPLIAVCGFIAVVTIHFCLIWKKQLKDPVNVSIELSPETMDRSANCNSEPDTVYAEVRRKNLRSTPNPAKSAYINEYNNAEEEDEEVSYADIVIHDPKRQLYNQQHKQDPDLTEKNTRRDFKYIRGSSPHKKVGHDTSEYSVVRQDLKTA